MEKKKKKKKKQDRAVHKRRHEEEENEDEESLEFETDFNDRFQRIQEAGVLMNERSTSEVRARKKLKSGYFSDEDASE